jgi:predicted Zn-dependent protease with MMP-like domain
VSSRLLSFEEFSARAKEIAASIPREFMDGVEDVVVHRDARRHPHVEDVVTLGECEPSPVPALVGHDTVRSIVHLYYGSFADLARRDDRFDVDEELRETVEHEVRHHLEDRAGLRTLIDEDDLFDAHARFRAGLDVPPGWYRRGERMEKDVYAVDLDLFVELRLRRREFEALRGKTLRLSVLGDPVEVEMPGDADPDEVFTLEEEGLFAEEEGGEEGEGEAGDLHVVPVVR